MYVTKCYAYRGDAETSIARLDGLFFTVEEREEYTQSNESHTEWDWLGNPLTPPRYLLCSFSRPFRVRLITAGRIPNVSEENAFRLKT